LGDRRLDPTIRFFFAGIQCFLVREDIKTGICALEQINFEKVYLLCKDLSANPCHETLVGGLRPPLSKRLKVKRF
jgi:hypothetical protein